MRFDPALREEARRRMAGFEFTRLASFMEGDLLSEVWRCKKPGTGIYSFDLSSTSRGTAVVGDMDGLLFSVGSDYGMRVLAEGDIAYIHSKLERQSREEEFSLDLFTDACFEMTRHRLEEIEEDDSGNVPEVPKDIDGTARLQWLLDTCRAARKANRLPMADLAFRYLDGFLVEAMQLAKEVRMPSEMLQRAYRFFEDKAGGAIQHDWYEYRLTGPSHDLQVRLHMVNLAAQEIQAQKRREREAAEGSEDAAEDEHAVERARG
jgi:hypothetical protein